jgi:hypothetical protein
LIGMTHRFDGWSIQDVTVENFAEVLPSSLAVQVEIFLPPSGSFDTEILRRYLENLKNYEEEDPTFSMTLANRLRVAFQDMQPDTICAKFPNADLPLKRRLRCVAEYLIRAGEFDKLRDDSGKLIKKRGVLGKLVVIYQPLSKMRETLIRQGLVKK